MLGAGTDEEAVGGFADFCSPAWRADGEVGGVEVVECLHSGGHHAIELSGECVEVSGFVFAEGGPNFPMQGVLPHVGGDESAQAAQWGETV